MNKFKRAPSLNGFPNFQLMNVFVVKRVGAIRRHEYLDSTVLLEFIIIPDRYSYTERNKSTTVEVCLIV